MSALVRAALLTASAAASVSCGGTTATRPPKPPGDADAQVVTALRPRLRSCYNQGLYREPEMEGQATFAVAVGASGGVESLDLLAEDGLSPEVVRCFAAVISTGPFEGRGQGRTLTVPIRYALARGSQAAAHLPPDSPARRCPWPTHAPASAPAVVTVRARADVAADGMPLSVQLLDEVPHAFAQAAVACTMHARFVPSVLLETKTPVPGRSSTFTLRFQRVGEAPPARTPTVVALQ